MAVILPSVYKDGTATVAANGVAVTGQGTMWLNTVLPGDFFGTHKGSPNRILAVNSNTSLTLAYPWLGGAQAAAAYEIMYQSDNARMLEAARQLLEKLSNGNVDALAGLVGGADKLPYFNGVGTMAQADLTAFARSNVLNRADRAALLATTTGIGVSEFVTKLASITLDANTSLSSGWTIGSTSYPTANLPPGGSEWFIHTMMWVDGAAAIQVAYAPFTTFTLQFTRWRSSGGVWSTWQRAGGSVVGAVLQSSGVPTGSVIERGTNANGDYVKYADGTQICWGLAGPFTTVAAGSASFGVSFSALFVAAPQALASPLTINPHRYFASVNTTNTNAMGASLGDNGAGGSSVQIRWLAIGRWF